MTVRQAATKRFASATPTLSWPSGDTLAGSYLVGVVLTSSSPSVTLNTPPAAPWSLVKSVDTGAVQIKAYAVENADTMLQGRLFAPVFSAAPNGILALVEIIDIWQGGGALEASSTPASGIGSALSSGPVTTITAHDYLLALLSSRNLDVQTPTGISQLVTGVAGDGNPDPNAAGSSANQVTLGLYTAQADAVGAYNLTAVLGDGTPSRFWGGFVLALKDVSGGVSSLGRAIADQADDALATQLVVNGPRSNALSRVTIPGSWPASMSGASGQAPTITMLPVDGISQSGGLVHANADVKGIPGTVTFQYGFALDTGGAPVFSQSLPGIMVPADFGDQLVSAGITGLDITTTYYVRAIVQTSNGQATSATFSFTTTDITGPPPSGPPTIDLGPRILGTTQTTITFSSDVSMHGAAGTVFGEELVGSGPDGAIWNLVAQQALPATADHTPVVFVASGLLPSTTHGYRIRATNPNGSDGDLPNASATTDAAPVQPAPTAKPAQSVTSTSATLVGQVDHVTNQSGVDVVLEIGLDTTYGTQLPVHHLTTSLPDSTQSVTDGVIGLTPATTYHYRVRAGRIDGVGGTILSADQAFTTLSPPVVTIPRPAMAATTGIGAATGSLNGTVGKVTAETPVIYSFDYGATTSYGSSTAPQTLTFATPTTNAVELSGTCDPQGFTTQLAVEYGTDPDAITSVLAAGQLVGTGPQAYRIIVAGLAKNTRYWFRVKGTSSAGVGRDQPTPYFVDTGP